MMAESCPHCRSEHTIKNGSRYRMAGADAKNSPIKTPITHQYFCHTCQKHFNKRISTRFRGQKAVEHQEKFFQLHFIEEKSARHCASELGIGTATAQRWRKQWLTELKALGAYQNPYFRAIRAYLQGVRPSQPTGSPNLIEKAKNYL